MLCRARKPPVYLYGLACLCAPLGIPILGINLGRLGFLIQIHQQEWHTALENLLKGDFWIESRMMLRAAHTPDGTSFVLPIGPDDPTQCWQTTAALKWEIKPGSMDVRQRPLTSVLLAAGIGWLLGRFWKRR